MHFLLHYIDVKLPTPIYVIFRKSTTNLLEYFQFSNYQSKIGGMRIITINES